MLNPLRPYFLGIQDEARDALQEFYAQFTQGFDTSDLIDTKALLDEFG